MTTVSSARARITKSVVDKFRCPEGSPHAFLWCDTTRGFGVRAMPDRIVKGKLRAGTKAFVFQGRVKGSAKEIRTTLGRCDEMSPDQARAKVDQLRSSLTDGVDPIAAKREAVQKIAEDADRARLEGVTLRQVMQHYIEKKKTRHGPLKPKSVADIKRHVDKSFAEWADMPVQDIC